MTRTLVVLAALLLAGCTNGNPAAPVEEPARCKLLVTFDGAEMQWAAYCLNTVTMQWEKVSDG